MNPVSLYVHIPFCVKKCNYCNFNSFAGNIDREEYLDCLSNEFDLYSGKYTVDTIFIGGGTPSILTINELDKIINSINKNFKLTLNEFTIECNPESLIEEKVKFYRQCGIDRLSIGIQSFNDRVLKSCGRAHDKATAISALVKVREHYDNINVDLISGFEHEEDIDAIEAVDIIKGFSIPHVSLYSLAVENNTPLYNDVISGNVKLPDEDTAAERYDKYSKYIESSGIERYEVSNYSLKGYKCKHNIGYWRLKNYLGTGLSAHSYIDRHRMANTSQLKHYIELLSKNNSPVTQSKYIDDAEHEFEYLILALRLADGIMLGDYKGKFNKELLKSYDLSDIKQFLNINSDSVSIKKEYFSILNSILMYFMH